MLIWYSDGDGNFYFRIIFIIDPQIEDYFWDGYDSDIDPDYQQSDSDDSTSGSEVENQRDRRNKIKIRSPEIKSHESVQTPQVKNKGKMKKEMKNTKKRK